MASADFKDLTNEISDLILDELKQTLPAELERTKRKRYVDESRKKFGFSLITRRGYTP